MRSCAPTNDGWARGPSARFWGPLGGVSGETLPAAMELGVNSLVSDVHGEWSRKAASGERFSFILRTHLYP